MDAKLVGNALVSAFIQAVFDKLDSPEVLDFFGGKNLDETLLSKLKLMLLSVDAVADDAEEKQVIDPGAREWLFEVKDAVLDAEDILDEIHCELSNCEVEAESESQIRTCKVPDSFNDIYSSFNREIDSRMKQVLDKLEYLANQKGVLGLKEATYSGVGSGSKLKEATYSGVGLGSKVSQKLPSTSLMVEDVIGGREDEKEMIFNWLTSETDNQLSILSIVGMGGIGKTTLAQLVYNDSRIREANFDIKVWVYVSDDFDVFKLTRSILETSVGSIDDSEDLEMVRGRLKEKLSGKRFFLVLDDVWNDSRDRWEALQVPLNHGAKGSRVLVTTRSERVASTMRSNKVLDLTLLTDRDCWNLFVRHAFQDDNRQLNDELIGICKEIVKKCKGLPLAVQAIGSLLHTKSSLSEFESVLHHLEEDSGIVLEDSGIVHALFLSYHHLPSYLKQCFAYCALFPKDYVFVKQDLILMWMAGNFLQCHQQSKSAEEIGEQYFNDLLSRSFFRSNMNETCFGMHDLIHDLAKYVCGDICFRLEVDEVECIPQKTRHFSFAVNDTQYCDGFGSLRTFMPTINNSNFGDLWLRKMSICELFSKFKFLRTLSLSWCDKLEEVPDSIGDLKHLRSLDLSYTGIKQLPDSICSLYNLQILKLGCCKNLEELPLNLHKLINLRALELVGSKLRKVPDSVGDLRRLYSLDLSNTGIRQLPDSICSLHNLQILKLRNCNNLEELPVNLHKLVNLRCLEFDGTKLRKVPVHIGDLVHLHSLDFSKTCIRQLPDSICSLQNLQILKLRYCNNLEELPVNMHKLVNLRCLEFVGTKLRKVPDHIGDLVHLHSLDLSQTCIKELPNSTCSLYNLQILKLSFCINLEELPSNLHKLVNLRCLEFVGTKLRKVPVHLGELKNLQITGSFYFDKSSEFSIQQLGELNFRGELSIGELQNVVNPSDALAVDLKNKRQLWELKLEWNRDWNQNQIPDDPLKEKKVFENLQPSEHLSMLSIMNYGGTQFPHWLFDNSLSNVGFLRLHNCKYCLCLPPLGLLPSLRHLTITGLDGIVGIYAYFYGSNSSPFKSLESLEFSDMKEWKDWESGDMTCVFPVLQHLSIRQCPKLKGYLPKQIPHLSTLVIEDCKQLVASAPTTQEFYGLELADCGKLQFDYHPATLKRLTVRGHDMEASMLKTIEHVICDTSLEFLLIDSLPNMNIPIMNIPMIHCYTMLKKLEISSGCDSLTIFPLDLFPRLSQLKLRASNLRMISQNDTHNHLKDLRISGCHQFQSLPEQMHALLPSLENLHIKDCRNVLSFPDGGLPSNLTRMDLSNCYNLIISLKEAMGANTCLRTLSIGALHVKSFPDEGSLPISLEVLQIHSCVWLEKLNYKGLGQLSSLEELILDDCTRLQCLPEQGLPRSISTLRISRCCSLLKQPCLEPEGQYLGKIAHIKSIWVDDKPIR